MANALITGIVVVLSAVGIFFLVNSAAPAVRDVVREDTALDAQVYISDTYNFAFEIPEGREYNVYTDQAIAIGDRVGDGFAADVEVLVVESDEDTKMSNFEEFVLTTTRNTCATDSPLVAISCGEVIEEQTFTTNSGVSGAVYYFDRIAENLQTDETERDVFGPVYVFDLATTNTVAAYQVLLVRPPANISAIEVSTEAIREVVHTLQLHID